MIWWRRLLLFFVIVDIRCLVHIHPQRETERQRRAVDWHIVRRARASGVSAKTFYVTVCCGCGLQDGASRHCVHHVCRQVQTCLCHSALADLSSSMRVLIMPCVTTCCRSCVATILRFRAMSRTTSGLRAKCGKMQMRLFLLCIVFVLARIALITDSVVNVVHNGNLINSTNIRNFSEDTLNVSMPR